MCRVHARKHAKHIDPVHSPPTHDSWVNDSVRCRDELRLMSNRGKPIIVIIGRHIEDIRDEDDDMIISSGWRRCDIREE